MYSIIPAKCSNDTTLNESLEAGGWLPTRGRGGNLTNPNFNASLCYNRMPENVTHAFLEYETAIGGYSVVVTGLLGFIGNILSIIVLSRKDLRKSCFNQLLIALLVCDNLHIFFGIMEAYRLSFATYYPKFMMKLFPYVWYPFYRISLVSSIYVIIAVAIERFLAVCHPHSYHNMTAANTSRSIYYIVPAIVAAFIIGAPRFFETKYNERPIIHENCTFYIHSENIPTTMRVNYSYIVAYVNWIWTIFTSVTPLIILLVLNGKIFFGLRRVQRNLRRHKTITESARSRSAILASKVSMADGMGHEETIPLNDLKDNNENESNGIHTPARSPVVTHMETDRVVNTIVNKENGLSIIQPRKQTRSVSTVSTAAQSREANMAVILVSSVTMFILCHLPRAFVVIFESTTADIIINCSERNLIGIPVWFLYIPPVVKFLQVFNAAINFPIYYIMGTGFRKSFHTMMGHPEGCR